MGVAADRLRWEREGAWEVVRPGGAGPLRGVEVVGYHDTGAAGVDMRVLPQPRLTLVLTFGGEPLAVESPGGRRGLDGLVAGLAPAGARIRGERVSCVEVRMSPVAAYSLLGTAPADLDGAVVGLRDLWGRPEARLRERMAACARWEERLALVDAFLARRWDAAPRMTAEVAACWAAIVARRGRVRVDELAAACGWSRKRLWSRFTAQVGLTPKRAAMLVRFDRAVHALSTGTGAAEAADSCGYADQSHLHRDVRAFAGCTPAVLAGRIRRDPDGVWQQGW